MANSEAPLSSVSSVRANAIIGPRRARGAELPPAPSMLPKPKVSVPPPLPARAKTTLVSPWGSSTPLRAAPPPLPRSVSLLPPVRPPPVSENAPTVKLPRDVPVEYDVELTPAPAPAPVLAPRAAPEQRVEQQHTIVNPAANERTKPAVTTLRYARVRRVRWFLLGLLIGAVSVFVVQGRDAIESFRAARGWGANAIRLLKRNHDAAPPPALAPPVSSPPPPPPTSSPAYCPKPGPVGGEDPYAIRAASVVPSMSYEELPRARN